VCGHLRFSYVSNWCEMFDIYLTLYQCPRSFRPFFCVCMCVLMFEPRALHMPGKHYTNELHPQPLSSQFTNIFAKNILEWYVCMHVLTYIVSLNSWTSYLRSDFRNRLNDFNNFFFWQYWDLSKLSLEPYAQSILL
jgi:hypothetical protein